MFFQNRHASRIGVKIADDLKIRVHFIEDMAQIAKPEPKTDYCNPHPYVLLI